MGMETTRDVLAVHSSDPQYPPTYKIHDNLWLPDPVDQDYGKAGSYETCKDAEVSLSAHYWNCKSSPTPAMIKDLFSVANKSTKPKVQ